MKFLFLDIDGVLNSEAHFKKINETPRSRTFLAREADEIDMVCVERVRRILKETGALIVLSSSWRLLHKPSEIKSIMVKAGWKDFYVHARTPRLDAIRGLEVSEWLQDAIRVYDIESYAILDDDADFLPDQPLVQTNWSVGIQDVDVEKVIAILNAPRGADGHRVRP